MFLVYSKPNCTYCVQAKALIASKGLEYLEIHLDQGQEKFKGNKYIAMESFKEMLPEAKTVPQIFYSQDTHYQYIGGFDDLKLHLDKF